MDDIRAGIDAGIEEMRSDETRRIEKAAEAVEKAEEPLEDSRTPFTVAHGGEICCEHQVWQYGLGCESGCDDEDCECGCDSRKCLNGCYEPIKEPIPDAVRAMLRDRDGEIKEYECGSILMREEVHAQYKEISGLKRQLQCSRKELAEMKRQLVSPRKLDEQPEPKKCHKRARFDPTNPICRVIEI